MKEQEVLGQILDEIRKTNQLLMILIDSMMEEDDDEPAPQTYMNGKPING